MRKLLAFFGLALRRDVDALTIELACAHSANAAQHALAVSVCEYYHQTMLALMSATSDTPKQ